MRPPCPRPTIPRTRGNAPSLFPCENPAPPFSIRPRLCPPPAPPSPSLEKPPSAGALTTLVFLYVRACPRPTVPRHPPRPYKTRRKNTSRTPFSHAEAALAAASFQKIQNKATKYENRVDIFKRFRYNKRKRGRLRVASTTALHKKVWKHSLIQPDNRHPVDSITDFRRDCKRIRKIRGFIVAPFSGEGPCRDALGCVPRDGFFVFVR